MPKGHAVLLDDLQAAVYAVPVVRLLVLVLLFVLAALFPATAPSPPPRLYFLLYGAAAVYMTAFTAYGVWRPARAADAARWMLPFDGIFLVVGAHVTGFPVEFVLLGFLLAVTTGILAGQLGGLAMATVLAAGQFPMAPGSIFPGRWISWCLLWVTLIATASLGAEAARRFDEQRGVSRTLTTIKDIAAAGGTAEAALQHVLDTAVTHFHANSGSFMLLDPTAKHLEVLASHGLSEAHRQAGSRLGEGIAGWVAQGGRAVLLTPGVTLPVHLEREGITSSMCIPVVVNRETIGLLNLNRSVAGPQFTVTTLEAAELVAQGAVGLLARAQHERVFAFTLHELAGGYARVGYALTRDPTVIWPALLDLVRSLTPASFALLATEREDTGNIEVVAVRGIGGAAARGLLPELIACTTRNEIRVARMPGASDTSVACVPLSIGERTIGALGLGIAIEGRWHRALLSAIGAHVAAAVDTATTAHRIADIGAVEERRRIAREIHDGLAQTLATALLQTDLTAMTAQADTVHVGAELKETRTLLEQGMRELREFLADLRRPVPVDQRLFHSLGNLAREFQRRHELDVTVISTGDDSTLPPAVRQAVLAIARQALVNVDAHAHASTAAIHAESDDRHCAVRVVDNGVGFDLEAYRTTTQTGYHLGLTSMQERAALVGGTLKIESAPNRGTTVVLEIPFGGSGGSDG
ncbi:MAG TPA: GAF domain-containing sensor histidine kinase [bacterium]|nr:GAF domain-containing sensor histidine kinase [bacterium]